MALSRTRGRDLPELPKPKEDHHHGKDPQLTACPTFLMLG